MDYSAKKKIIDNLKKHNLLEDKDSDFLYATLLDKELREKEQLKSKITVEDYSLLEEDFFNSLSFL